MGGLHRVVARDGAGESRGVPRGTADTQFLFVRVKDEPLVPPPQKMNAGRDISFFWESKFATR